MMIKDDKRYTAKMSGKWTPGKKEKGEWVATDLTTKYIIGNDYWNQHHKREGERVVLQDE